ncbi:condensin-2 complex subunit G2 [Nerophis lumbriciformis]|uniref:condensin-2 complex subunit G2 n=1 Tax=Nerophis lumbriciformis TaxID=546530 RepID=UPI002ADF7BBC|nr:condensin-2 complex subunit G2 [Nerophis lumbriciformis]XP_061820766.1 condensin-2 complex subunit G2 [Nerophis lumbriciformis]
MSKLGAFVESATKDNVEDFLQFIKRHKDKADPFDAEEVVQEMSRKQRASLWGNLASLLQVVLAEVPPERWEEDGKDADGKLVMAVVDGITLVASVSLNVLQDGDAYNSLLDIAHQLQNVLLSLPVSAAHVPHHIQTLCEAWWKKGLQDKETFGHTAFIISLQKSFVLDKVSSEIQRVWSLHEVLLDVDYASNKQLIDQLLQCFHSPAFIGNDNGKRFLVFLFSWNIDFICLIHNTVKNHLEFFSKSKVSHIAEIYFRAWKKASGDFLEKMENVCIQDFMHCAILLHRTSPVHGKVRQIVSYFHMRKACPQVEKMLNDLYKPILWKALCAPNFEVRANATFLFTSAFPIHDPDQSIDNIDAAVQKQLNIAMDLLDDPNHSVRANATLGVCNILAKCWELLPPAIIADFLKKLVSELASDISSPDVRCCVFKCLSIVLDNPLSHPLLEKLLPTLKYSLHDKSEKVRMAFLDMLIKVKAVRAAKFWDVCNMEHLLARLSLDSQSVSKRVVDLLFKSFFPVNDSEREWCSRCITLIQMNPAAARKFYQYAFRHTAPTNIIKLMLAIRRVLNSCIQAECSNIDDSNKENSIAESAPLTKDMMASLLEVVAILWRSINNTLKHNKEAQKFTYTKFGSVMSKYFNIFEDERCTAPLIQMASLLPANQVPTFSCGVLSRLRKMNSEATPLQYGMLLDCMCMWGKAASLLELITDWLTEALPNKQGGMVNRGQKVQIFETVEAKPDLALAYLEYILIHSSTRDKVLALSRGPLSQLHTVLGNWKAVLYSHLSGASDAAHTSSVALKAFTVHGRLSAHMQHDLSDGREYLLSLEDTASWVAEKVLPFLAKGRQGDTDEDAQTMTPLAIEISENFLSVCKDVVLVGLADDSLQSEILQLCLLVLLSDTGYLCIPAVLPLLKEVMDCVVLEDNRHAEGDEEDAATVCLDVVANIFQKIIELLARRLKKEPEEGKQLCQLAVPGLTDFLWVAQTCTSAPLRGVFSTLFALIVVETRHTLQKITNPEEVMILENVEDMPPLSAVLLSVILKSSPVTRAFLVEVVSSLDVFSSPSELVAVVNVLAVLRGAGQSKACLKTAAAHVQQQLRVHADSGDIHRLIQEAAAKTLDEMLN